jgi:NAD(P)H dehydrogenase (quinone)
MGFGYGPGGAGNTPLLTGRMMFSITSSGAPQAWMRQTGMWDAMRKLSDEHVAAVCGLAVVEHLHFGDIVPGITADAVAQCAEDVAVAVRRHFGPPSEG